MSIEGVYKTKLNIIPTSGGNVLHGYKHISDINPQEIKEVYFSTIKYKQVRAWKMHTKMTVNLVVPIGSVRIKLIKENDNSGENLKTQNEVLSQDPYFRLTIPPGIWFSMEGLTEGDNLICNIADYAHDPKEVLKKDLNFFG
tara:strand:+ start:150 stop:575 length:426 start_codon:yes stop_codon:yes gene_type:complete